MSTSGTDAPATVFVAGASGAIGRPLCRGLLADGWRVVGTTRSTAKREALRAIGVTAVVADAYDEAGLREAVSWARPRVVIHQLTDLPPALDADLMEAALVRNARLREVGTRHLVAAAVAAGATRLVAQSIAFAYAAGPMPYTEDRPLAYDVLGERAGITARGVAALERQVLGAGLDGVVLRYGKLYGPGTGFDRPAPGGAVHVEAAAEAARIAARRGPPGIYNVAEEDGAVSSRKARELLGWRAAMRVAG